MKYLIINGPNLNLLGSREVDIYGYYTYKDLSNYLNSVALEYQVEIVITQTNHEGKIIDYLHQAQQEQFDGVILNAGAYTHYSYAIYDAIKAINVPVIEVHLSDIYNREEFRKTSVIKEACLNSFYGEGFVSYYKALKFLIKRGTTNDY